jgi:hypothetical protein
MEREDLGKENYIGKEGVLKNVVGRLVVAAEQLTLWKNRG